MPHLPKPIYIFAYALVVWLVAICLSCVTGFYYDGIRYDRSLWDWSTFEGVWIYMVFPHELIDTLPGFYLFWAGLVFIGRRCWTRTAQRLVAAVWAVVQAGVVFLLISYILKTLDWRGWPLMAMYTIVLAVGMLVYSWQGREETRGEDEKK